MTRNTRLHLLGAVAVLTLLMTQVVSAAPPVANFTVSDSAPDTGQVVTFTSAASDPDNDILAIEWDFGYDPANPAGFTADETRDGAPHSVSHTYDQAGDYFVAMRVTDGTDVDGTVDTHLAFKAVNVSPANQIPVADDFTWQPQGEAVGAVPSAGQRVRFRGTGHDPDADPITYEWDFGDGDTATGQSPSHVFSEAGTYAVSLRVRDNRGGLSAPRTKQLRVNAAPAARTPSEFRSEPPAVDRRLARLGVLEGVRVLITGTVTRGGQTRVRRLFVRAPRGSKIVVRCRSPRRTARRSCGSRPLRRTSRGRRIRFRKLERVFRAPTRITVSVTKQGFIGRYTRFKVRRGRAPLRSERCLTPGARRPSRCPRP